MQKGESRGLSARECETALQYAQGKKRPPHISEQCFVSAITAKTHLKTVYAKTGYHSKQELIDVVNSTKS